MAIPPGISSRVLVGLAVVLYSAVWVFALYTKASTGIGRDQWLYLTMLTQYYEEGFDLSMLWFKHGEHMLWAYNAWFLLNGVFFGLDTRLELFLGFVFLGGFLWLLYKAFDASVESLASPPLRRLLFIPLLLLGLGFTQLESFSYGLLSFCVFGEAWLMMAFIIQLDRALRAPGRIVLVRMTVLFVLLATGFAGGGWLVHLGAALLMMTFWMMVMRGQRSWSALGALLGTAIIVYGVNSLGVSHSPAFGPSFGYVFLHPLQAGEYVLVLLANSVLYVNALNRLGFGWAVPWLGGVVLLAHFLAIYLFCRGRMWERTMLPFYFLAYFWLVAVALVLYRFPVFGGVSAASPRYASTLQVGTLGVLWVFTYAALVPGRALLAPVLYRLSVVGVACLYGFHLMGAVHFSGYLRGVARESVQITLNERFDEPSVTCPNVVLCRRGEGTLKAHGLNVFRGGGADAGR